jgi:K+-sensing histidine kinase KdpD
MRAVKGMFPIVVSAGLILAITAILWRLRLTTGSSHGLIYFYLFPVALIAVLYNGRLAVLSTVIALLCADFFLEDRLYSFVDDNPLEYGDLFVFVILAVTAIKFIRALMRPRTSLEAKSRSA